jgi:hypothetical protein
VQQPAFCSAADFTKLAILWGQDPSNPNLPFDAPGINIQASGFATDGSPTA